MVACLICIQIRAGSKKFGKNLELRINKVTYTNLVDMDFKLFPFEGELVCLVLSTARARVKEEAPNKHTFCNSLNQNEANSYI